MWALGCTTLGPTLIAQLRVPAGIFTHVAKIPDLGPDKGWYLYDGALIFPDAPWERYGVPFLTTGPFPWGLDVLPD